jgi:poly-gamma-glutamate capsule biosynthesis protein CapA/YwtB (metallophosphatase superfamily)
LKSVRIFLAGDVMTGRGVDQILPTPCDSRLHESHVRDATRYVALAEAAHGLIPRPVDLAYPWGDSLVELERLDPDIRIVNLETAVTTSDDYWPGKGIHYRMHPANVGCLSAAGLDCCVLANNHVLDWGYRGLADTLSTLDSAGLRHAGAGADVAAAATPVAKELDGSCRVLLFAWCSPTSGLPAAWAAEPSRAGVNYLADLTEATLRRIAGEIEARRQPGDIVIVSIHWGGNWGYDIDDAQRRFARGLIDEAGVAVVHGHSSHHPRAAEVYRGRLILYGCGDLLSDYEGIRGYESYRDDLVLMYFADLDSGTGCLSKLRLMPFQLRKLRLNYPEPEDVSWLRDRLSREYARFGHCVRHEPGEDAMLSLT